MATSAILSFTFPSTAFLEAIRGKHTKTLRRVAARARITASYGVEIDDAHIDSLLPSVRGRRPCTATGVAGERWFCWSSALG